MADRYPPTAPSESDAKAAAGTEEDQKGSQGKPSARKHADARAVQKARCEAIPFNLDAVDSIADLHRVVPGYPDLHDSP